MTPASSGSMSSEKVGRGGRSRYRNATPPVLQTKRQAQRPDSGRLAELTMPEPRPDIALRPPRDISPYRSIHATWLRDRRVPGVPRMLRYLADAAEARLSGAG